MRGFFNSRYYGVSLNWALRSWLSIQEIVRLCVPAPHLTSLCFGNMSSAFFKLLPLGLVTASLALHTPLQQRAVAYTDPRVTGGSTLDSSAGLGEPLNVSVPQSFHPPLRSRT
jgi:hypothetical protein